jgi:hypothetical protein
MDEARKTVLYASSRTPRARRPCTPPSVPRPSGFEAVSVRSPVEPIPATSGTTTRQPVKTALSPAFARSTMSSRTITSSVRGMQPAGISEVFSCTRTRCQSAKRERFVSSVHLVRLAQPAMLQSSGSVYLNCCLTPSARVPQSMQVKTPSTSSGRTSEVRVTVPLTHDSCPTERILRSRILLVCGMPPIETENVRLPVA